MDIRVDREDAPLRARRHSGPWRVWLLVGVVSGVFWLALMLMGRPVLIDLQPLATALRFAEPSAAGSVAPSPPAPESMLHPVIREPAQPRRQAAGATVQASRQTVFNESNYRPRTDINIMAAPTVGPTAATRQRTRSTTDMRNHSTHWEWVGANRQRTVMRIEWQTRNGWIEHGSVCGNLRQGSIEYRDCRKAAKDYFRHRCRADGGRAFCHAEDRFRP